MGQYDMRKVAVFVLALAALSTAVFFVMDLDADGLINYRELLGGTGMLLPDTDGDGLSDGVEPSYNTEPLSEDTDGDDFPDGIEVEFESSPTDIWDVPLEEVVQSDVWKDIPHTWWYMCTNALGLNKTESVEVLRTGDRYIFTNYIAGGYYEQFEMGVVNDDLYVYSIEDPSYNYYYAPPLLSYDRPFSTGKIWEYEGVLRVTNLTHSMDWQQNSYREVVGESSLNNISCYLMMEEAARSGAFGEINKEINQCVTTSFFIMSQETYLDGNFVLRFELMME